MSDTAPTSRRLAAILPADIAGYSALVGAGEEGTTGAATPPSPAGRGILALAARLGARYV